MDGLVIAIWLVRLLFLFLLYLFLWFVVRALLRDLRSAVREPVTELGRLVVIEAPGGEPAPGTAFSLEAVTTLGRDINSTIAVEDEFASARHASLSFRGRAWYVEDHASTNGTYVNGSRVVGVAPLWFGDELQVGRVRFRLERPPR